MNYQAQGTQIDQPISAQQAANSGVAVGQAMLQNQRFADALAQQNGIGNQSAVFKQQQALANQLQDAANGGGPNPALAQLNQTTGQNVANQAALMAGQRGAGQNAGLLARQAAMQGSNAQQQAVGQAATMAAQQQIAARQALQQQQGMMGNLATSQVGQQANAINAQNQFAQGNQAAMLNSVAAANNARVSMQSSMNAANSAVQQQTAQQQGGLFGGLIGGIGAAFGLAHGGEVPGYDDGGLVNSRPDTDIVAFTAPPSNVSPATAPAPSGPKSKVGQAMKSMGSSMQPSASAGQGTYQGGQAAGKALGQGVKALFGALSGGDSVSGSHDPGQPANLGVEGVSPTAKGFDLGVNTNLSDSAPAQAAPAFSLGADTGSLASSLSDLPAFDDGGEVEVQPIAQAQVPVVPAGKSGGGGGDAMGAIMKMLPMLLAASNGKLVPGKAKAKGDSTKNDTVPAMLSPGEIVLPRSVTQAKDAPEKAAKFVAEVLAKKRRKK